MAKNEKSTQMRRHPQQARSQERVHHLLDVAEQLLIELGYEQTTTRAIAARAEVPVGSLYQFFPDKRAIVKALADRYFEQEYHLFVQLHAELATAEIAVYVDRMVDAFDQFAKDHPGYQAILEQAIDLLTITDINSLDLYDQQILAELADFLTHRNSAISATKAQLIATVVVKIVNELLGLSLTQDQPTRAQLVIETKTLITAYLQTYNV